MSTNMPTTARNVFFVLGLVANDTNFAATNTSLIQAALTAAASGGVAIVPPGLTTVYITNPSNNYHASLLLGTNVEFAIGEGSTLTLALQSNCFMLRNSDTSNGNAHITICGGGAIDGNQTNQTPNTSYNSHLTLFIKCDDLAVHRLDIGNVGKYAIYWSGCNRLRVSDIRLFGTGNNTIQGIGPSDEGIVQRISGVNSDNSVAILTDEVGYYDTTSATYYTQLTQGPCRNWTIRDVTTTSPQTIRLVGSDGTKYASSGWYISDVLIENIRGTTTSAGAVTIMDDTFVAGYTNCKYENIVIRDVDVLMNNTNSAALVSISAKNAISVRCYDLTARNPAGVAGAIFSATAPAVNLKEIVIDGATRLGSDASAVHQISMAGVCETMTVQNVRVDTTSTAGNFGVLSVSGTVTNLEARGTALTCAGLIGVTLVNTGVITYANVSDVYQSGGFKVMDYLGSGTGLSMDNISGVGGGSGSCPILSVRGGGVLPRLNATNIHRDKGYDVFEVASDAGTGNHYWNISNVYIHGVARMFHLCKNSQIQLTNAINDGVNDDTGTAYLVQTEGGTSTLQRFNVSSINSANAGGLFTSGTCTITGTP